MIIQQCLSAAPTHTTRSNIAQPLQLTNAISTTPDYSPRGCCVQHIHLNDITRVDAPMSAPLPPHTRAIGTNCSKRRCPGRCNPTQGEPHAIAACQTNLASVSMSPPATGGGNGAWNAGGQGVGTHCRRGCPILSATGRQPGCC